LQPVLISNAYEQGDIDEAERLGAMDCIDCGNCSYVCPANIPLLDNIRQAKTEIKARKEQS
jgi:electron transport complex protein RnfC